jgi:hypothetical protein
MPGRLSYRAAGRLLLVAVVIAGAAVGARVASPSQKQVPFSAALACGTQRWNVKTLADRPRLLPARRTTVARLGAVRAPASLPNTRLPFERHLFTVTAAVTQIRPESDSDLHVALSAGGHTMIAESAAPICATRAALPTRRLIDRVRPLMVLCARARVTGVAFFDFLHGQTGAAPNGIELHPILRFRCLRP